MSHLNSFSHKKSLQFLRPFNNVNFVILNKNFCIVILFLKPFSKFSRKTKLYLIANVSDNKLNNKVYTYIYIYIYTYI